ncbi:MAG: hypothetical protein ACKVS7_06680 [Gemmatimonadaceae bacterium]
MSRVRILLALVLLASSSLAAQQRPRPASTLLQAVEVHNAEGTIRVNGPYDVPADREVASDVAVLNGPVDISGTITGTLVAINADVRLRTGARIRRDLVIVGGTLTREDGVTVDGEVRTQAELLRYTMDEGRIVPEEGRSADWRPHFDRPGRSRGESYTDLFFVAAKTYNRVEGLPILVGPRFRRPTSWGRVEVEAFGVVRSAEPIRWDRGTLGHDAKADLRLGVRNGLVIGGRLFDVIAPVESWQLTDTESGLASFLLKRDMRDYYGRHGWEASFGLRLGEEVSLSAVAGSEQWRSVAERRPFTLFRDDERWRVNSTFDPGRVDLASARLRIDTRERVRSPWRGGWYINADLERGSGSVVRNPGPLGIAQPAEDVTYTRGFIDARRYNRISPGTELNLRVVAGGSLGGDSLPMQRRFTMSGPGALDGYDFRRLNSVEPDVFTCGTISTWPGRPGLCDRIALAQVELRQSIGFDWDDWFDGDRWWQPGFDMSPAWVLYADAGRGWKTPTGQPGIGHAKGIPPLSTFRTSIGAGIDFGSIGIYLAKAVSTSDEPVNVIVRMGRRF